MKRRNMKSLVSLLLVLVMLCSTVFTVFGTEGDPEGGPRIKAGEMVQTTIPFTKTTGDSNYFTYSTHGWSAMGASTEHVWSDAPGDDPIWYEVKFVGKKIDVYAGKNRPMGFVEYFIDDKSMGKFDLYNGSNINSTLITTLEADTDGEHVFRAVSTGEKRQEAGNTLIDCANLVVYHAPYPVTGVQLAENTCEVLETCKYQIQMTAVPDYAELTGVTYRSLNEEVAVVDENGVVTGVTAGDTTIEITVPGLAQVVTLPVKVQKANPEIHALIVSEDYQYGQKDYFSLLGQTKQTETLTAWAADQALSEIVILSKGGALTDVTVTASDFSGNGHVIGKENVTASFIQATKAYNGFPGYGSKDRPVPPDDGKNRVESRDILDPAAAVSMENEKVQPVWIQIAVPSGTPAGTYTGTISVGAKEVEQPVEFTYTVNVQGAELPPVESFKDTFDIELWQYPYTSAEYYGVEPFSQKHLEIMTPIMNLYKSIGGHAITTSIVEEAWDGQTYSKNPVHYPSMVKWTKNADGSMSYDYTDFDAWVSFNQSLGIGDKIVLYSIAPWHGSFTYWEGDRLVYEKYDVNSERYKTVWSDFLRSMIDHLMEKGWFDQAYIGIDERGFHAKAFDVIDSVKNIHMIPLKTAGAMDGFVDKKDLALRVTDLNVGDTAVSAHPAEFQKLLEERTAKGYRTTLYSCTGHRPGNFALSAPVESYWSIINAGAKGTAGFLRWAYDAWVEDPLRDVTHNAFEPGDVLLVYPDEKTSPAPAARSSVRLQKMAEGVRDVNKLMFMVKEIPSLQSDVDGIYAKLSYQANGGVHLLNDGERAAVKNEMDVFRQDVAALTEKYVSLKQTGTDQVASVEIQEKSLELSVGQEGTLHAAVLPENLFDRSVLWSSDNEAVATVDANGKVTGKQEGTAVITAVSKLDPEKSAFVNVTVQPVTVDPSAQVSYYSFDNLEDQKVIVDEWGKRNGTNAGSISEGISGQGLHITEEGKGVALEGTSGIADDGAWTVGYWVKTDAAFNKQISPISSADKKYAGSLKMAADRDSGFRVGTGGGDVLTFKYDFKPNQWYHVTWTQSKTDGLTMYVNGNRVANNAWTKNHTVKFPADLLGSTGFTGWIDEVKIYNKVLNQEEVNSIMQLKGLHVAESQMDLYVGKTKKIDATLNSDLADKTLTYTSDHPEIAQVDEKGVVTGKKTGTAIVTVENKAGNYTAQVTVHVTKWLNPANTLPEYKMPEANKKDIEKKPNTPRQYLGQPDMILTKENTLITAYPVGHGKGPLVMQVSEDEGETWTEKTNLPESWKGSQETPTLYTLNMTDGTQKLLLVTACPGWGTDSAGNKTGWNTSISEDGGKTWSEYKHWHSKHADGRDNNSIVAMASLIQLKDEKGQLMDKWMGVYHDYGYVNYKTYLTFDQDGKEQWTAPEPYLSEYRDVESSYQMCEIGMFRSPDGKRIVGLARSQCHNNYATLIYSDDEGETWSKPMDLPGSLAGERHKAAYDPITGRLLITFREICYDLNENGKFDGNSDWKAGDWIAWVGTYEDLMEQNDGQYRIRIAEDHAQNAKGGDTGYAGIVTLEDGTFLLDSYGHWDKEFSENWGFGKVTTDLCYIKQAKFRLDIFDEMAGLKRQFKIMTAQNLPEAGTVTGEGVYEEGTEVTLSAKPAKGYHFVEWRCDGQVVGTEADYSFAADRTKTVEAVFEKDAEPTAEPTKEPTIGPTVVPTKEPTAVPTKEPTKEPTAEPTKEPTKEPTVEPTKEPTIGPTVEPTKEPTAEPTKEPTAEPTKEPTAEPTKEPTAEPTKEPTAEPTKEPTAEPTKEPVPEIVDKEELSQTYGDGAKLKAEDYTEESWKVFQSVMAEAKKVLNDTNATAADVEKALADLQAAEAGLVKKAEPTKKPVITSTPDQNIKPSVTPGGTNVKPSVRPGNGVNTADQYHSMFYVVIMLTAVSVMGIWYSRKRLSKEKR